MAPGGPPQRPRWNSPWDFSGTKPLLTEAHDPLEHPVGEDLDRIEGPSTSPRRLCSVGQGLLEAPWVLVYRAMGDS